MTQSCRQEPLGCGRLKKHYAKWQRSNVQIAKRFITRLFARDDNSRHPRKTPQVANEIASK
jgi:hypothetical protein